VAFLSATATFTGVNHFNKTVKITQCDNVLQFDAGGISDGHGISLTNIKLYSSTDPTNLITNGNFELVTTHPLLQTPPVNYTFAIDGQIPG